MHIGPRNILSPANFFRLAIVPLVALLTMIYSDGAETPPALAAGRFNPQPSGTLSTTDPGSHPDLVGTFNIGVGPDGQVLTADDTGDYNFGGVLQFAPTSPTDADIPDGAILGELKSIAVLGVLNNPCNRRVDIDTLPPKFVFEEATTDITNTFDSEPWGPTEPLGQNDLARLAGDTTTPPDGVQDVNPPPVVTKYPSFLNAIFDPDWVDFGPDHIAGNADDNWGPSGPNPIKPVFRQAAVTSIGFAGNLWVILQTVVFAPGTKLPQLPAVDAGYGFPSVTVLQTASAAGSATPTAPSAITDFCTPLHVDLVSYGVTHDNPATAPDEGGIPTRTLPDSGDVTTVGYYLSQRDADGDSFENSLDTCPLNADTVWNPHSLTNPAPDDTDTVAGLLTGDGIPNTCDPTPNEATGLQPTDHDNDGFPNSGDNCPLIANPDQSDKDPNENGEPGVGDGIGDACDPNPGAPDGAQILCVKLNTITVGGPHESAVSDCLSALPPLVGGEPPSANEIGAGGASGAGAGAGTTAGRGAAGTGGGAAGGAGGPASGVGSLSPVGGSIPAWAAVAAALGAAGAIGSAGTLASRLARRRRNH